MAKATKKKQNNRADPIAKKDVSKKDEKEEKSSKDPKQSHLCKYDLPYRSTGLQ